MATNLKHPCPDCRHCQWCSDDRCRLCLREHRSHKKLSLAEQIAHYEKLNQACPGQSADKPPVKGEPTRKVP